MNNQAVINQLEKALEEKDDKTLRIRIEVLLGMLKDLNSHQAAPQPVYGASTPKPIQQPVPMPNSPQTGSQQASAPVIEKPGQNRLSKKQLGEDFVPGK